MTWSERVRQFDQTAPKARLIAAGFMLGAVVCVLFAPLYFTELTTEDALSYAIGLPLLAVVAFVFIRLLASARKRFALLFILACGALVLSFVAVSDMRLLNDRGERTDAVVVQRKPHPRSTTTYKLAKSNGAPIGGELLGGGFDVGDRVEVVADPLGKVDPVVADELSAKTTAPPLAFALVCGFLLTVTTWGAASAFKNRPHPSAPPGPPSPGGTSPTSPAPPGTCRRLRTTATARPGVSKVTC